MEVWWVWHFVSNMTHICYDCIHWHGTNCCYRERFLCNFRDLVCPLELFLRSSDQHYLQHQFTDHVQIERIQKCGAAAAAGEKFSWSKKVFLPLTCYSTNRHHTERYIWNERRSVSFMSWVTGQQSLWHFCMDLEETILHGTIFFKALRKWLPTYSDKLSNWLI